MQCEGLAMQDQDMVKEQPQPFMEKPSWIGTASGSVSSPSLLELVANLVAGGQFVTSTGSF